MEDFPVYHTLDNELDFICDGGMNNGSSQSKASDARSKKKKRNRISKRRISEFWQTILALVILTILDIDVEKGIMLLICLDRIARGIGGKSRLETG